YQLFLTAVEALISSPYTGQALNNDFSETLKRGLNRIQAVQSEKGHTSYWSLVIQNLLALKDNSNEIRDAAMAENLRYLVNEKYKDEKVIVWAANGHIMKHTGHI